MAKKVQKFLILIVGIVLAILFAILYIVRYSDTSPIANYVQWISGKIEGFSVAPTDVPLCPKHYKFFNDTKGESMCCAGNVDPYKHTCDGTNADDLCAFIPGIADPRDSTKVKKLPLCSDVIKRQQTRMEAEFCPKSLPNHANGGKCCAGPSDPVTGDCFPNDLKDLTRYCLTTAPRREHDRGKPITGNRYYDPKQMKWIEAEQLCANLRRMENAQCPGHLMKMSFDYFQDGKDKQIPLCAFGPEGCIPSKYMNMFLTTPRAREFVKGNPSKSKMNCDVYKRVVIDKDLSFPTE